MKRPGRGTLAFTVPAAIVVGVSLLLTRERGGAAVPEPARFSGSVTVQRLPSLLGDARLPARVKVAVIRDDAAASFYDSAAVLDSIAAQWRRVLDDLGAQVRVVRSSQLEAAREAKVIVVPSSPCLSLATWELLDRAASGGTGIVLTGRAGVMDAACRPIGYGLVVAATGATRAAPLDDRSTVYVTFPAGSPLTSGIPPGARAELRPATQIALRRRGRDAIYTDYAMYPAPAHEQPLLDAAVTHGTYRRARVVYWGFDLHDAVDRPWTHAVLRLLARNSIEWAAALPNAEVEPWPLGRRAAAAIAQDVEAEFGNARFALDSLRAIGVPTTFFLTSELAARHDQLSLDLRDAGEIGTHSENHRLLGGLPLETQRRRLRVTQDELRDLLGATVIGLRPPQEQFDEATMRAWLANGGTYLFGANDSRSAAPELLDIGGDTLVLLGRVGGDDFAIVGVGHGRDTAVEGIARAYLDDFEHLRALGGMFVLSYHSQLLGRPEYVPALARVARALAADTTVWLTTTGRIANWWRARAALSLHVRERRNGVEIEIRNSGDDYVQGAVARVRVPRADRPSDANVRLLANATGELRFVIPTMEPRSTLTATVLFRGERGVSAPVRRTQPRKAPPRPERRWFEFWKR